MAEFSGPQTDVDTFDASRWRDFYDNLFSTGVFKGGHVQGATGGDLAVTSPSGLNVSVAAGAACLNGFLYASDAAVAKTLAAADPSLPRIDTVVLSWAYASGVPTCVIAVKQGTPASSPVAPTLTQNDTTYELALADCRVNAAASTIASVTDRRKYAQATLGFTIGHASGNIPISDGTVNTNFVADMVDGYHAGHSSGQVPVSDGVLNINLNADLLDGHDSTYFLAATATAADSSKLGGVAAASYPVRGSHNAATFTLSAGTSLPGTLDANEVFFLLA